MFSDGRVPLEVADTIGKAVMVTDVEYIVRGVYAIEVDHPDLNQYLLTSTDFMELT